MYNTIQTSKSNKTRLVINVCGKYDAVFIKKGDACSLTGIWHSTGTRGLWAEIGYLQRLYHLLRFTLFHGSTVRYGTWFGFV